MKSFASRLLTAILSLALASQVVAAGSPLIVWSHWSNEQIKKTAMGQIAKDFETRTGVKVEFEWMEKNELKERLQQSWGLGKAEPDIAYVDLSFKHPRITRSLADLSDLKIASNIDPSWSLGKIGEHGELSNLFLPIEGSSIAVYYNKTLFAQAGIEVPTNQLVTEDEFLAMIGKLKAQGITPVGEGVADRHWKAGVPLTYLIFRHAGPDKLRKLRAAEIDFSDPDVQKALQSWKRMVDAGAYDADKALSLSLLDGIFEVLDGRAGMSFCGTWIYSKYGQTDRDRQQLGVMEFFAVDKSQHNDLYTVRFGPGYGINKHSPRQADARKFLEFLLTPSAAEQWLAHVQSPYPQTASAIPDDSLYAALAEQRRSMKSITYDLLVNSFPTKAANNAWTAMTRKFITGKLSVAEFTSTMNSRLKSAQ